MIKLLDNMPILHDREESTLDNIIRVTGAVNRVHPANPLECLEEIKSLLAEIKAERSDIIVLPSLALCSPSCGNLFRGATLASQCGEALDQLLEISGGIDAYILVGTLVNDGGRPASAVAVLHQGDLVGLVAADGNPPPLKNEHFSGCLLPADTVFGCGNLRFSILSCDLGEFPVRAVGACANGADLLVIPGYTPSHAGYATQVREQAKAISGAIGCAIAVVNGGVGGTSSPHIYSGLAGVYECGREIAFAENRRQSFHCTGDLDLDVIWSQKKSPSSPAPYFCADPLVHGRLRRPVSPSPWLPEEHQNAYLQELFAMQIHSLACRMENIGVTRLVLGVSGGLDSTIAMLVCAGAMDALELPRENITAVTMPGFGTSDRTYYNALSLPKALGASCRDIPIREAVQLHLEEIGHTGRKDTTYENAQARERTQILLDIANAVGGLVVGTGDLSEAALGFCTFAGDQTANYNVNICIPKSVLRELAAYLAEHGDLAEDVSGILLDILDTPISPELLPPSESGDIQQKTEDILGPYELHDFFLYYFLRYSLRPVKLYFYACTAFAGKLEPGFIKEKLKVFLSRYCAAQFKRAAAPDCASITEVNLCGHKHYIPSDLDPSALLLELEEL